MSADSGNCVDADITALFNKKFEFDAPKDDDDHLPWNLPEKDSVNWQSEQLKNIKEQLNKIKSLTGQYDLMQWSEHTKSRDPSQGLFSRIRQEIHPELLTQAWLKFYEILSSFYPVTDRLKDDQPNVHSVHLCEAPGAFIAALNHYLASEYSNYQLKYLAMTLNPYYSGNNTDEMINSDRFILNNFDHWFFGADDTGDIKTFVNYQSLVIEVKKRLNYVDLITADGSVNCMEDPGNQENIVAHLIYCETITALSMLSEGGTYIFKMFTMFEMASISLLYLVNYCFEKVVVFKPFTSKGGNSEVYVICKKYFGPQRLANLWPKLLRHYKQPDPPFILNLSSSKDFLDQIENCAKFFADHQSYTITNNLESFNNEKSIENISNIRSRAVDFYTDDHCKLKTINDGSSLFNRTNDQLYIKRHFSHTTRRYDKERVCTKTNGFVFVQNPPVSKLKRKIDMVVGKSYESVKSVKFIDSIPLLSKSLFIKIDYSVIANNIVAIDCSKNYTSDNFNLFEVKNLESIIDSLRSLPEGDSLCLANFLPITIFSVNIICILESNFKSFSCHSTKRILLFENYTPQELGLNQLEDVLHTFKKLQNKQMCEIKLQRVNSKFMEIFPQPSLVELEPNKFIPNTYTESVTRFLDPRPTYLDSYIELIKQYNIALFSFSENVQKRLRNT